MAKMSLAEISGALDSACERLAARSVGEAEAICNQISVELPHIAPAHFHLLATYEPFLFKDSNRNVVMVSSRLSYIRALIAEAKTEGERFSTQFMAFMVNSHQFYNEVLANERNASPKRLMKFGRKSFSQSDEDGLIEEVFRRIGERSRKFVEIGVQSGVESNTTNLLAKGWSGAWVECSENFVRIGGILFREFLASGKLQIVHQFVTAEGIDALLTMAGFSDEIEEVAPQI